MIASGIVEVRARAGALTEFELSDSDRFQVQGRIGQWNLQQRSSRWIGVT